MCPRTDGLQPEQWEARERQRALVYLPRAREVMMRQIDSIWVSARPRGAIEELQPPLEESFILGGVYDMGGPRYAHSCLGFLDSASLFSLQWHRVWASSDSVISAVAILGTDDFAAERGPPPRVYVLRDAIALRALTDATLSIDEESAVAAFSYSSKGVNRVASIILAREDTAIGKAFVAHVRERAGLSALSGGER